MVLEVLASGSLPKAVTLRLKQLSRVLHHQRVSVSLVCLLAKGNTKVAMLVPSKT
jgi:hypothetical protein